VRILLWHGYLLTGSGSNVYTANIAREWRAAGHDVVVMCQDRSAGELPFVDEVFEVPQDPRLPPRERSCRVALPFIASLLPVYVYDEYQGFEVKRFVDLTDDELDRYTSLNVDAMVRVLEAFKPEVIVTGHEVMGPYIARKACERTGNSYVAKLHGSALEYAVKIQARYRDYAIEGLGGASRVIGGSHYMVTEAASVIPGWEDRAAVVNPGCDVDLFRPSPRPSNALPRVAFVGKLIASKGVHHLLVALGLVGGVRFRVVVVGYGGFEEGLRELADALHRGDARLIEEIAFRGESGPLEDLLFFARDGRLDRDHLDRYTDIEIEFTGRLEHAPLARLLPTVDVLVVPSVVPEAFGMVAAEAAASGVLPIVPDHSGIAEAGAAIEDAIGAPGFLTFDSREPIVSLAAAIERVLRLPRARREEMGAAAAALARERWSWGRVAQALLDAMG